jgi:hypothetical protein
MRPTIAVYPGLHSSTKKNISLEQARSRPAATRPLATLISHPRSSRLTQVPMAMAVIAHAASYIPQVVPNVFSEFNLNINLFNI